MHNIEPFYGWRDYYTAETDSNSPFYQNEYSEFEFTHRIYNYLIHPQWDFIGSGTLFVKLLFCDYDKAYCIIELLGEWNDCLYNDIMYLTRNLMEPLQENGINKFILIGDNLLNFHYSDTDYYEEFCSELADGWVAAINFRKHIADEFKLSGINNFITFAPAFKELNWRSFTPDSFFHFVEKNVI